MPTPDDIVQQQDLLTLHRRNLAHYLKQQTTLSQYVPPHVEHGINEARSAIARIKSILRDWNIEVKDHPDDEEIVQEDSNIDATSKFLSLAKQNLIEQEFDWKENVKYPEIEYRAVSSKTGNWYGTRIRYVFAFFSLKKLTLRSFQFYCKNTYDYVGKRDNFLSPNAIFPVAIAESVEENALNYVRSNSSSLNYSLKLISFPIIYNVPSKSVFYYEGYFFVGLIGTIKVRNLAKKIFAENIY